MPHARQHTPDSTRPTAHARQTAPLLLQGVLNFRFAVSELGLACAPEAGADRRVAGSGDRDGEHWGIGVDAGGGGPAGLPAAAWLRGLPQRLRRRRPLPPHPPLPLRPARRRRLGSGGEERGGGGAAAQLVQAPRARRGGGGAHAGGHRGAGGRGGGGGAGRPAAARGVPAAQRQADSRRATPHTQAPRGGQAPLPGRSPRHLSPPLPRSNGDKRPRCCHHHAHHHALSF
eukprot:727706-Rhodomonas_salina.1